MKLRLGLPKERNRESIINKVVRKIIIKGYEITIIRKDFMKVDLSETSRTASIWEKRKCFICGMHFKDEELVTAVFTKEGKNLLACEKCSIKL